MSIPALLCLLLVICVSPITGQRPSCPGGFAEFVTCIHQRLETSQNSTSHGNSSIVTRDVQAGVNYCFTGNGCDQPDYGHDPSLDLPQPIRSYVDKVRQEIGNAPPAIEQCLKATFSRATDECVAAIGLRHLVANTSSSKVHSSNQDWGQETNGFFFGDTENTTERRRAALIQVNIAAAIRRCSEKKGDESKMKPVLQCLFNTAKADGRRSMCQAASGCDENETSTDCRRQRRREMRAVCMCRLERQKEVLDKLDRLRKTDSVPVLDVVTALGRGKKPEDMSNDIRACFVSNGSPPPPSLALLDLFIAMQQVKQKTDKPGSSQMRVDQQTLAVIRDLYNAGDYGDGECAPCDV